MKDQFSIPISYNGTVEALSLEILVKSCLTLCVYVHAYVRTHVHAHTHVYIVIGKMPSKEGTE